ncbi:acyltransferase family protein [Paraburkholderia sediminicola]|uniref:acyltransferase family protein n=1 Tax=Paraburkholderia sediminicola TaxID=458836 RepID=UPI0038BDB66C
MSPAQADASAFPDRHAYAPYIDGLRALAVLSVIVYHLHSAWLPGGLAGVDIFFVISGFVVSASVGHMTNMSFSRFALFFYARRMQRIAPALIVCLLITGLASALLIPSAWLSNTNDVTGFFAFFGLSNVVLAKTGNDYFSPRVEFNPYMHTWSLGVEEQFYLIFPILFFLWVSRKQRKGLVLAFFFVGFAISLLVAKWLSARDETLNFYLIAGRFWELAAGVMLYQLLELSGRPFGAASRPATRLSLVGAFCSMAALVASLVISNPGSFPFPGAILPALGTLGVLAFLNGRQPQGILHRTLTARAVVFIGKISYSLYLWHWPVLVLLRWTTGVDAGIWRVVAVVLTFALATASYYLVENPIRRAPRLKQWPRGLVVSCGVATITLSAALSFGIHKAEPALSLSVVSHSAADWYPYGSVHVEFAGCREQWDTKEVGGGPLWIFSRVGCAEPPTHVGNLYVIGDSHAQAYNMMFRTLAVRTGVKVFAYNNGGCPFIGLLPMEHDDTLRCKPYDDAAVAEIIANVRPGDVVFMPSLRLPRFSEEFASLDDAATQEQMFGAAAQESRREGTLEAIPVLRKLAAKGAKIVFEAPEPVFKVPAFRCADWFNRNNPICAFNDQVSKAEIEAYRAPVLEVYADIGRAVPAVSVWDPLPTLCPGATCSTYAGGKPLFFDGDHISGYANQLLLPSFERFIGDLLDGKRG